MSDSRPKENISDANLGRKAPVRLSILAIVAAILAFIGIFYFGYVLYGEYQQKQDDVSVVPQESITEDDSKPISILPQKPEGVTIIAKMPELVQEAPSAPTTSIVSGNSLTPSFGLEVSSALSFLELSTKFAEISQLNGAENFHRLEPRAILTETVDGLIAKLIIGPFESEAIAQEACDVLILPADNECIVKTFEGELIARE